MWLSYLWNTSEKQIRGQKGELTSKQCKGKHAYNVNFFILLDKGHEADNLQKEYLFLFYCNKNSLKKGENVKQKNGLFYKRPKGLLSLLWVQLAILL